MTRSGRTRTLPGKSLMMLALFVRLLIYIFKMAQNAIINVFMYIGPVLTWACTRLVHEAEFGCFRIICNSQTSSYLKDLDFEKLEGYLLTH